jgi:hypothetical protein
MNMLFRGQGTGLPPDSPLFQKNNPVRVELIVDE